jgi:hypothetical protein
MSPQVNAAAVQAGILKSTMGREEYLRLEEKYGHERLWLAFSNATKALSVPRLSWKIRLRRFVFCLRGR